MTVKMYDSVTVSDIPADAPAVAGYVNGKFATFPLLEQRFTRANRLSIAVTAAADAECLDVEAGDARPDQAAGWVKRQMARSVKRPILYASVSQMTGVLRALTAGGIRRDQVRLWTAHYTHKPHICSPACGFGFNTNADATQWTDHSEGRHLDESLCSDTFFTAPHKVEFSRSERRTIDLIQTIRSRPSTAARRGEIRALKVVLLGYRVKLRVAAAMSGWDREDRRARYEAILAAYKGDRVDL
ncbi:MAG: hypothetical protein ACXVRH_12420 [Thermoleophilaceae bacterium]